jgi:hypothetical protein
MKIDAGIGPTVDLGQVPGRVGKLEAEGFDGFVVADGLIVHASTTPRFLREVTLPAVDRIVCDSSCVSGADRKACLEELWALPTG